MPVRCGWRATLCPEVCGREMRSRRWVLRYELTRAPATKRLCIVSCLAEKRVHSAIVENFQPIVITQSKLHVMRLHCCLKFWVDQCTPLAPSPNRVPGLGAPVCTRIQLKEKTVGNLDLLSVAFSPSWIVTHFPS